MYVNPSYYENQIYWLAFLYKEYGVRKLFLL